MPRPHEPRPPHPTVNLRLAHQLPSRPRPHRSTKRGRTKNLPLLLRTDTKAPTTPSNSFETSTTTTDAQLPSPWDTSLFRTAYPPSLERPRRRQRHAPTHLENFLTYGLLIFSYTLTEKNFPVTLLQLAANLRRIVHATNFAFYLRSLFASRRQRPRPKSLAHSAREKRQQQPERKSRPRNSTPCIGYVERCQDPRRTLDAPRLQRDRQPTCATTRLPEGFHSPSTDTPAIPLRQNKESSSPSPTDIKGTITIGRNGSTFVNILRFFRNLFSSPLEQKHLLARRRKLARDRHPCRTRANHAKLCMRSILKRSQIDKHRTPHNHKEKAPRAGLEPATRWLTATCSTN